MRIEVKGRNLQVTDELREVVARRFEKVSKQVSEFATLEIELTEERNPANPDQMVAEATLYLKGVTLRAKNASKDSKHSINLVAEELSRQVKRHRDKRRKRRESRALASQPARSLWPTPRAGPRRRSRPQPQAASLGRMSILDRALRLGEARQFKSYAKRVDRINEWEPELELLDDDELRQHADELRERARGGEALDDLLPETFALVREVSRRTMAMRHFDVQMIGGMVLNDGAIAEMRTGEGKTLTATTAVVLNALAGKGVHLVTVNDYLARRDADWMRPIYEALGLSLGVLQNMQPYEEKRAAYAADITYGTNSEFGFDYLRDNMATTLEEKVQHGGRYDDDGKPLTSHNFAIVDEVDNILIDEARTPLIISGAPEQAADLYERFAKLAPNLEAGKKPEGMDPRIEARLRRRLRLRVRREAQERLDHRARRREGREVPRDRPPLQGRERPARQPPDPVAEGRVAVQARRRLRGDRRRGQDHRRVHRPHPRRPPLVGGPAPGGRGEGGRPRPRGEPDARDDHAPELLPHVRQARGHDGHGADRGDRVHEDLQAARRRDPDEPADGPRRPQRPDLQDQDGQVERGRRRDRRSATTRASRSSWARSRSRSPSCSAPS